MLTKGSKCVDGEKCAINSFPFFTQTQPQNKTISCLSKYKFNQFETLPSSEARELPTWGQVRSASLFALPRLRVRLGLVERELQAGSALLRTGARNRATPTHLHSFSGSGTLVLSKISIYRYFSTLKILNVVLIYQYYINAQTNTQSPPHPQLPRDFSVISLFASIKN